VFASDLAAMKKADDGIPETVGRSKKSSSYVRDASGKTCGRIVSRSDREEDG